MKLKTKSKFKIIFTLVFIFAILPIITINNSFLKINSNSSDGNDRDQGTYSDPYGIEDLATSSMPVVLVWSYNTSSRNRNVAISSNGQYIALACYDFHLYLFEKDDPTPLWTSNLGEGVQSVAITPDGQFIVAGTTGNYVYFFEKNSSTPLWSYNTGGYVTSLAISDDGQYIAAGVGRDDYAVYLFEKNSSTPLWRYGTGYAIGHVNSVGISSDGNYIVAGAYNGNLYYFRRNSSTPIWTYKTPNWAYNVAISSDGNYIVVGDTGGTNPAHGIYFFERSNSTPLWSYVTWDPIWSVAISSDGQYIVVGTGYTGSQIYFFERNNSTPLWSFNAGDNVRSVAISSNGQYVVAGSFDRKVYFFDTNSSSPIWSYSTVSNIQCAEISSDGHYFTAGCGTIVNGDSFVYLFHLAVLPHIEIHSPILNQLYGLNAPEFSITPYSLYPINTTWYTLDGGLSNYTFSGLTGVINQTAWDKIEDGVLTVRFYANNSLGHVDFKDVQIFKESINPVISIHYPRDYEKFGNEAPIFTISIVEENLKSTWYTIDNLSGTFPFSDLTGIISQNVWSYLPEGPVNISFYAQDEAGNIGSESVIVIKRIPSQIPGYNLLFLLGVLCTVTIIVSKRLRTED